MENKTKQLIKDKWDDILLYMKNEYNISPVSYGTWLKNLKFYDIDENILTVIIQDNILGDGALDFIRNKYGLFLKTAIAEVTNEEFEISFVLNSVIEKKEKEEKDNLNPNSKRVNYYPNQKYTFDNFVVGDNNASAHAAALAVAEAPGTVFNPLFIYGGPGLGKTHLMFAIQNYLNENTNLKVLYVTSENFTNDLIESLRSGNRASNSNPESFRQTYRNNDVLLIDDIQFIIGKETTQQEFFHTFNDMRNSGRQIIISSDRPPRDMTILDERMKSRFEWGLTVDIQPPSYETRMAILKKKQQEDNLNIEDEILEYIANNIKSNIRTLEGALNRVVAMSRLQKKVINLDLARDVINFMISPEEKKEITPEFIIDVVAEQYDLTPMMIRSKTKSKNVTYPRQIAMYLCKQLTSSSLSEIGAVLGNRHHTTILYGCEAISNEIKTNSQLENTINILIKKINPDN